MPIFKQNRWIMPLLGVVLACFSAIILLLPTQVGERGGGHSGCLPSLSSGRGPGGVSVKADNRTKPAEEPGAAAGSSIVRLNRPELPAFCRSLRSGWKPVPAAEWLSAKSLARKTGGILPSMTVKGRTSVSVIRHPRNTRAERWKETVRSAEQAPVKQAAVSRQHPPAILYFSRTKLLSREERSQATRSYTVSEEDVLLLRKIVMAEAEGEPYEGKVAVANVVLNRLRSANFPGTIKEVIYQKFQFSPVANGRLKRIQPNQDSVRAVAAALSGVKEVSDDTYYFLSLKLAQDLTVHHSRIFSEKIGNHSFYR